MIAASYGGAASIPAWYHNLAAAPDKARIEVNGATIPVSAEQLHGAERDAAWQTLTTAVPRFSGYPAKTDREIPVIRLTPSSSLSRASSSTADDIRHHEGIYLIHSNSREAGLANSRRAFRQLCLTQEKDPETGVRSMTLRKVTVAILAAIAFTGTAFSTALPASASVRPVVVYTQGMEGGWSGPAVRPAWIDFGADWIFLSNPPAKSIRWTHWTIRSAYGAGRYLVSDGCCHTVLNYPADIALTDVQHHGSTAYFRDATITARGHRTIHLWYGTENTPYGPLTGWHGSAVG